MESFPLDHPYDVFTNQQIIGILRKIGRQAPDHHLEVPDAAAARAASCLASRSPPDLSLSHYGLVVS